jgi:hypothetical protein
MYESQRRSPLTPLCTTAFPSSLKLDEAPHRMYEHRSLVTRFNEVVRQILNGCCAISGYHGFVVVCDEDSLLGLDDNDTISALLDNGSVFCLTRRKGKDNLPFWHRDFGLRLW